VKLVGDDQDVHHTHTWGPEIRRDFCHYVQTERQCRDCPAVQFIVAEVRDFDADPLQITFANPDCPTCRSTLHGRAPVSWQTDGGNHAEEPAERSDTGGSELPRLQGRPG
jgi:hypothetical protein